MKYVLQIIIYGLWIALLFATQAHCQVQELALKEALNNFRSHYKVDILFSDQMVEQHAIPISSINLNQSLERNLEVILKPLGLRYKKNQDNAYFILPAATAQSPAEASPVNTAVTTPAGRSISGQVTDEFGNRLPGVTVMVKGTAIAATTNSDGQYTIFLANRQKADTLMFAAMGYLPKELPLGRQDVLHAQLQLEARALREVVVIGYGTARKIDLTGGITRVNLEEKYMQPNVNMVQVMRGSVAGVAVADNGRAGAEASIVIRGHSSISGSNEPLIVLDGIPYSGGLSDISTNDIESIDVLKDGSSAAIYGSRASNGVIMITTKRGKTDKPTLHYNAYAGFSAFAHVPRVMGPEKYLQLKKDASAFTDRDLTQLNPLEEQNFKAGKTTNPWEQLQQDAPMHNHELNISGRTNKINYYVSGSYVNQKSPLLGDKFSRISGRVNLDLEITNWLKVGTNTGYTTKDYSGNEAEFGYANLMSPYAEFFFEDGTPRRLPMNDGLAINPVFNALRNDNKDGNSSLFNNIYALVKLPLKGLTYQIRNGSTLLRRDAATYIPIYKREGFNNLGSGTKVHSQSFNLTLENIVKYERNITAQQHLDLTLLYGIETYDASSSRLSSNNIFNDALSYNGLHIGENQTIQTTAAASKAVSGMARLGYRALDRYMLNLTVRRDGYSAFGVGRKYGAFPSMGVSWVLSNENFMESLAAINLLKIRYAYGKNGNRGVAPYASLGNLGFVHYVFGDGGSTSIGLNPASFGNPLLGWETTVSSNLGIDMGLFKNRISGSVEFYNTHTSDLLLNLTIPNVTGYSQFLSNIGKMNNKGIEVSLTTINMDKGDFQWSTNFIYTRNRNKVIELAGKEDDVASSRFINKPLFSHYDYTFDGIWQEGDDFSLDPGAKPGYIRFKDLDGDGKITPADRSVIGTSQPDFTWGMTNGFSYKGFLFSFLLNGRVGGISPNPVTNPGTNFYDRVNVLDLPYWTPENRRNDRPSVGYPNPYNYGFYQKRDYVRLQDLTISYAFAPDLIKKANLANLKLYISGKNIKTWTDWDGYDPEHGSSGIYVPSDGTILAGPLIQSWVVGLSTQF